MTLIPDAPWIRDAELNGYPVDDDISDNEYDFTCPMPAPWLTGKMKGDNYD